MSGALLTDYIGVCNDGMKHITIQLLLMLGMLSLFINGHTADEGTLLEQIQVQLGLMCVVGIGVTSGYLCKYKMGLQFWQSFDYRKTWIWKLT